VAKWQLTGVLLLSSKKLIDLLANLTLRDFNIILGLTIISHQRKETVIRDIELEGYYVSRIPVPLPSMILPTGIPCG
jgi:hypothetical protein